MFPPPNTPDLEDSRAIEAHALGFVDAFPDRTGLPLPRTVEIVLRNGADGPREDEDAAMRPPVVIRTPTGIPVLYLRTGDLTGRPASVLEGGLAMELAGLSLHGQTERFRLNFEKVILPLFNVSGSAVQFLRRLTMHLENGLKRYRAVRVVVDAGYGSHLVYYFYHILQPSDEDRRNYGNMRSHHWIRAMYLAQKTSVFLPLTRLDEAGIGSGMGAFWRSCHDFLAPEDHRLIADLAIIPRSMGDRPFADQVTAMVRKIQSALLD